MSNYLPWWATAVSLALITLGFYLALHRPLGVSGSWARVVMNSTSASSDSTETLFRNNPALMSDALMAATIEEFGREEVMKHMNSRYGGTAARESASKSAAMVINSPKSAHVVFLLMLVVGGMLGAWIRNDFTVSFTLGDLHNQLFGTGLSSVMLLFFGGVMVGFGTQLAGGCTSGHGLSGVSRLIPSSMVATFVFFASAVAFSLLAQSLGV